MSKREKTRLRLIDLEPERDTWECRDGSTIEFREPEDLGGQALARYSYLQTLIVKAQRVLSAGSEDPKPLEQAGADLDMAMRESVRLILPEIKDEELASYRTGVLTHILEWYQGRHFSEPRGKVLDIEPPANPTAPAPTAEQMAEIVRASQNPIGERSSVS